MKSRRKYSPKTLRKILLVIVLVVTCTNSLAQDVSALTSGDLKSIINYTAQYQKGDTCGQSGTDDSGSADSSLTGGDGIEKAYNFFTSSQGGSLSPVQAAAVVGNLDDESHLVPTVMQKGGNSKNPADADPLGWGIAQWSPGSKITGIAKGLGITTPIYQLGTQLQIVYKEMTGTSPVGADNMIKGLSAINDLPTAVEYFRTQFEGGVTGTRLEMAQDILKLYGNNPAATGTATPAATGGCASGTNGSINGSGNGNFTDNTSVNYPGLQEMQKNVQGAAEPNANKSGPKTISNDTICGSSSCLNTCMHTMAALWGYASSGYSSPFETLGSVSSMWNALKGTGHEHAGDRNVPVGALLIYSGHPGHVVIYLGKNLIVSTDTGADGSFVSGGGIHVVSANSIEKKWGMTYVGWVDPVFYGNLGYGTVHY